MCLLLGPTMAPRSLPYANYDYVYKISVIGDINVGKTSFLELFATNRVRENYVSTIGVDFFSKLLYVDGENYKLQFWDTSGQERFRSLVPSYLRDAKGVILMYDITDPKTFANLPEWMNTIQESCLNCPMVVLIGNKTDLESEREVAYEEARGFANENNLDYLEMSTRNQGSVDSVMIHLARRNTT